MAKGARRPKGPFESALDLLALCRIVFLRKSSDSLDLLTEAKLERRFRPRRGDLSSLYAAYYVAELLNEITDDYDSHPRLFDAADATLVALSGQGSVASALVRFELAALREIGTFAHARRVRRVRQTRSRRRVAWPSASWPAACSAKHVERVISKSFQSAHRRCNAFAVRRGRRREPARPGIAGSRIRRAAGRAESLLVASAGSIRRACIAGCRPRFTKHLESKRNRAQSMVAVAAQLVILAACLVVAGGCADRASRRSLRSRLHRNNSSGGPTIGIVLATSKARATTSTAPVGSSTTTAIAWPPSWKASTTRRTSGSSSGSRPRTCGPTRRRQSGRAPTSKSRGRRWPRATRCFGKRSMRSGRRVSQGLQTLARFAARGRGHLQGRRKRVLCRSLRQCRGRIRAADQEVPRPPSI